MFDEYSSLIYYKKTDFRDLLFFNSTDSNVPYHVKTEVKSFFSRRSWENKDFLQREWLIVLLICYRKRNLSNSQLFAISSQISLWFRKICSWFMLVDVFCYLCPWMLFCDTFSSTLLLETGTYLDRDLALMRIDLYNLKKIMKYEEILPELNMFCCCLSTLLKLFLTLLSSQMISN